MFNPDPDFSRPPVEEGPNGQTVINWTTADLFKPFSEGGPTGAERARILRQTYGDRGVARDIVRASLAASVRVGERA